MDELDLLKKDWKKEHVFEQVSETAIYKMLHKKSSSIVKWILVISVVEFLVWTILGLFNGSDDYIQKLDASLQVYFKIFDYGNYAVILFFIFLFYKNYKKITISASTKQLMNDILDTRRMVKYYIWYNLFMIVVSFVIGFYIAFTCNPEMADFRNNIAHSNQMFYMIVAMFAFCVVVIVVLFWLFYRLVYGILLKKLRINYEELKRMEV